MSLDDYLEQQREDRIRQYSDTVKAYYEERGEPLGTDFRTEPTQHERRLILTRRKRGEGLDFIASTLRLTIEAVSRTVREASDV